MPTAADLPQVLAAIDAQRDDNLADLLALVAQPSISTQNIGVAECAQLELALLRKAGLEARLIESDDYPMVYAEWLNAPGQPTILFYGHYDVRPPDPLELWHSDPFTPEIREGRIYGRGVADNKAQHFSHIAALRAWMTATGGLPVNVKVLLEGEEEVGSPHLDRFVRRHGDLLATDLVYTSDGPVTDADYAEIAFGVRGLLYIELRALGANRDLHSGHWGGVAPNPVIDLMRLLGTMIDENNGITIEGFHDDIVPPTPGARAAMDRLPFPVYAALGRIGLDGLVPPAGVPYPDRIMARPTLNVAGIGGGYQGPGSKTVIPHQAVAKIDMRLVPNQHPERIWEKVRAHVAKHAPHIEVIKMEGTMLPSFTPVEHPLAEVVRRAVAAGFGKEPIDIPLVGGSLPDATWTQTLGKPSFLVPYGAPEQANHAPNESYRVERLWQGIATSATLLAELAAM